MSDELRRKLARAAGEGDIEAFHQLGRILAREGKDVDSVAAQLMGFTNSAPDAFRAIRNNVIVKGTVDILNRERARWLGERLRVIRGRFSRAQAATTNEVHSREWHGAMADLSELARRAESQRYPEFFEDWRAVNESLTEALRVPLESLIGLTPDQRRILGLSRFDTSPNGLPPSSSPSPQEPSPGP